jgi:hypothetical protein
MVELLVVALFTAFFIVLLSENFYLGIWKALWAVVFSAIAETIMWNNTLNQAVVNVFAEAFLAIVMVAAVEKLADF